MEKVQEYSYSIFTMQKVETNASLLLSMEAILFFCQF